ncbi:MAG TPA: HAMP domain-containing sensor histidine kinase [Blastocatellia bacterium]|nr:HAMP domain-containing sensor histidine kinase [Blastocatellia bacterium]
MPDFSTFAQPNNDNASNARWSQDDILAMVSHELRNPTWVILSWADIIIRKLVDVDTLSRAIEIIKRSAQLQAQLLNQLLDFSGINNASLKLETQRVALLPVLEASIETMTPQAIAKAIELNADFEWSAASVIGDPVRLQQVFTNILSNAIKFTQQGGRVDVWFVLDGNNVEINVRDNGRGISAEFLPFVFDRFRQESVEMARHGGLGLGLAIARYLVEEHGGGIYAHSHGRGKGATFTVRLPLEP